MRMLRISMSAWVNPAFVVEVNFNPKEKHPVVATANGEFLTADLYGDPKKLVNELENAYEQQPDPATHR